MKIVFFLLICATLLGHQPASSEKASAVQIVHFEDHSMRADSKMIDRILANERLKDRHIVVFSIAGPYRKGKSFFLNFPLKYLYAQYVKHDISDWIGENDINGGNNELNGFKWRGGQKPETTGIWMWSEIFTHDYDNGERVAIILLDTQGIYDHSSSIMDCTATFAVSMMLSSVQCYNVMQNVQEDNLQDLDYFTQYGTLASEQKNGKPFQSLLFLVRDWPYADETGYGYAPKYVDGILTSSDSQTPEMRELRARIRSSFEKINAFLMPYPGSAVAEGRNSKGDLRQMDPKFVQHVKEIVPSIFAPENLLVKQINGQKLRAQDFLTYLQGYIEIFNGKTLPEPKTALRATAEASILILLRDCLQFYVKRMDEVKDRNNADLLGHHENARMESLLQSKRKLPFPDLISSYQSQLAHDIDDKYATIARVHQMRVNEQKRIEQLRKWEEQQMHSSKDKGWNKIFSVVGAGVTGGLCTLMGWHPVTAAACAAGGAALSMFN